MATFAWRELLTQWSADILESSLAQKMSYLITSTARETSWLGAPGATEEQISAAETRLNTRFPPSYRTFLATSNGWSVLTQFAGLLWPTDQIERLATRDPEFVRIWTSQNIDVPDENYFVYGEQQDAGQFRTRYLRTALQISNPRYLDGEFYLLNPQVVTQEGEWEAWFFASWLPGATRYRSFWELMQNEYESFLKLKDM